jgi:hypothetical protein
MRASDAFDAIAVIVKEIFYTMILLFAAIVSACCSQNATDFTLKSANNAAIFECQGQPISDLLNNSNAFTLLDFALCVDDGVNCTSVSFDFATNVVANVNCTCVPVMIQCLSRQNCTLLPRNSGFCKVNCPEVSACVTCSGSAAKYSLLLIIAIIFNV